MKYNETYRELTSGDNLITQHVISTIQSTVAIKLLLEGSPFQQRCLINAGLLTIDGLFVWVFVCFVLFFLILASLILRKSRPLNENFLKKLEIGVFQ